MEVSSEEKLIDLDYDYIDSESRLSLELKARLNFEGNSVEVSEENEGSDDSSEEEEDDDEEGQGEGEEDEEEEFSFMNGGELPSPVAAEDAFANGQIKAVFPLFNQELLFSSDDSNPLHENLPIRPPVKKVFLETSADSTLATSSSTGDDEIAGPYCEWSNRKAVEASEQACKKSNSTGFSKIWRLKEFIGRTNSDGRDAFVFLNNSHPPSHTAKKKPAEAIAEESGVKTTRKVKKSGKSKTTPLSAHEVYIRNKKKDGERRRPTYLPYRPELVGFFTTLNGGLTKNVHPY